MQYFIDNIKCTKQRIVNENCDEDYRTIGTKLLKKSKYFRPHLLHNEDLINNIATRVWIADATFNPEKSKNKESWRISNANWEIYNYLKGLEDYQKFDTSDVTRANLEDGRETNYEYEEQVIFIEKILNSEFLSPKPRQVVRYRYYDNLDFKEIAVKIGMSRSHVQSLYRDAVLDLSSEAKRRGF